MKPSFIHILLCDNDYGQHLEKAARLIHEAFGTEDLLVSEEHLKRLVVNLVIDIEALHHATRGWVGNPAGTRNYLTNALTVVFSSTVPNVDHDSGSVAIDRNTGYIWRF